MGLRGKEVCVVAREGIASHPFRCSGVVLGGQGLVRDQEGLKGV